MSIGRIGRKCGVTRVFTPEGQSLAVTVIEMSPNKVTQLIDREYQAVQLSYGKAKPSRVTKPLAGHYAKAGVEPGVVMREFRLPNAEALAAFSLGQELTVDGFAEGQKVDVTGISKGKGFAGVIKRYNFRMQDASHGNSRSHRAPGSSGQNQTPGKVFKGKKMAGQMGNEKVTVQSLKVVRVDLERHLLLVQGAVPGANGGIVFVQNAQKAGGSSHAA